MKKSLLIVLFVFITSTLFSQIKLSGVVKDSIGNPLEMANVIAMNVEDGSLEGYSITDTKGNYKIKISKPGNIEVKVSYLGFDSQSKILVISEDTVKNFVLYEAKNSLNEVEVTYEMPVTIKGDTIVYNADSFTSGNEKKLGDVLKKLPGVEVNKDGDIEVDGKTVSKIMVEGKDFFDGDTKLATKNIPADAIKKVEVLKNYNEVSQMRGLGDDSDNVAINIKLKEGKKNFWFGEVTAGAGEGADKARYLAHPKLFYYSPDKSINIITDLNNIGEIPFTFQDYFKFSGGFKNMMKSGGIKISSNSLGFSFLKDNKAKEIANKFAAVNFSQAINKHLDFSGFAIFSNAETELETNSSTTSNVNQNNEITELTNNNTKQNNNLGLLKLSFGYKPNSKFQLDYDIITKMSDLSEHSNTNSFSSITGNNTIHSNKDEKPFSIKQSANLYYTLNDKNIFSFASQYFYETNNPLYNSINSSQRFADIPTTDEGTDFNLSQNKKITTSKLDATLDYYYILNNKSNLNFTLGSVLNTQTLTSNIFQTLDNNAVVNFTNSNLNNDVNFNFTDVFLGFHYKLQAGIFTLTPGVSAHQYISKNDQLGNEVKQSPFYLLPDFTAKIALKRSESIRLNYSIATNFTDIQKLAEGILYKSYNSLSAGNRNLDNALYHKYGISYFNFNSFSFTNIHGGINYTKKYDVIKNTSRFIGIDRINSSLNIEEPEDNLSARLRISKRYKKIKASVSGNVSVANTYRLRTLPTNVVISNKTKYTTQKYKASVATNFKEWPNFEVGYEAALSKFDDANSANNKPFANVEISFLKNFILTANYAYNHFKDSNNNINIYDFLNANLYYQKEGSKWEFKASAINLLDTKSINDDYFSTDFRSTSQYIVQPRYLMFTVKYDL